MKRFFRLLLFIGILLLGSYKSHALVIGAATSEQQPSCQGALDGWVTIDSLITSPPTGPYVIRINTMPVQFFNVGDTVFNLTSQNYIITILDLADNSVAFAPVNFASSGLNAAAFSFPASCFGVCDGSASVAAIGGSTPYTFAWDDPLAQTTQVATNLCAGVYRVTVSDNNGCTIVDSTTVAEPPQILPNVVVTDVSCFGFSDGSATSTPSGGTGTFVGYAWSSSGNTTPTEGGLAAGTYTITVTDNDGCTGTQTFTVGQPADLAVNFNVVNVDCFGDSTGSITSNVSGGTTPYTFNWIDGPTTQDRVGIPEGTYTVTITDNNGCVLVDSATVIENPDINITLNVLQNNDCFGDTDGRISGSWNGGSAPYSFDWSNLVNGNGANSTIINLAAGTYTVTVTDNLGCTQVDSIAVTEQPQIQITVDNVSDPSCNGDSDGSIDLTVSGGTPALTFDWNTLDNTEDISSLGAGTYTLTVTDANGCTSVFDTTLNNPPLLTFIFDSLSNVSCNGLNDGYASVLASGGTGAYTYNWSNIVPTAANPNLIAGTYTITVTDANGCTAVDSTTITQPAAIAVTMGSTDASCAGINDGTAQSTPSGGTPPYTYLWAPPGSQTTQNITGLAAGTYTVTVTDQNGCTGSNSVVVGAPTAITINITPSNLACNGDNSGAALANVLGGNPPYTFLWDDPLAQTTNPASSLAAGTYRLTVTDNSGCTAIDSVTLTEPAVLAGNLNTYDVSCGGVNDGAARVLATGGTLPYTYQWGPGNPTGQGTDSISALTAGNYSLTLTDDNGCNTTFNFTINQSPPTFSIADSSVDPICNGGNTGFIGLQISGGAAPFNYNWTPGPLPNQPNQPGLSAGTYNVTVTDNNGCTNTRSITLNQPPAINVIDSITDESCFPGNDGIITLIVSGGTPGYNYNWSPPLSNSPNQTGLSAGTYDVTITDLNACAITRSYTVNTIGSGFTIAMVPLDVSCNGLSDGSVLVNPTPAGSYSYNWSDIGLGSSLRAAVSAGTYTVTVTDTISGCFVVDSATVNEPPVIQSNLNITPDGCSSSGAGSVTSNPSGGNGAPFNFAWNTPGGTVSGNSVTNLSAGTYDVTITDNNGCTLVDTFTVNSVTSNINPNDSVTDASCFGVCDGFIRLNPTGGVAPYFFVWSDLPITSPNRSFLCAGNYTVTITGSDNCDTVLNLTVGQPPAITANINTTPDTCVQGVGGARVISASNGTPPYTYDWPFGGVAVGDSVRNLTSGNYDLTITDNAGCQSIVPFTIGNDANFTVNLTTTPVTCSDGSDGTITVNVVNGTSPVTYDWSGGLSGPMPNNLRAGIYTITVTDALGCGAIQSIQVIQPPRIQFFGIQTTPENCIPGNDGTGIATFTGGTPPYNYSWPAPGIGSGNSVSGLPAGNYNLTFADANGCDTIVNFTIGSAAAFNVNLTKIDASCNGAMDGSINLSVTGASPPLTYNWSDIGLGPQNRTNLGAATYVVTITDATGCPEVASTAIREADAVRIVNIVTTDESCSPGMDGTATSIISGGISPYTYTWSSSAAVTPGITGLIAGVYELIVTDSAGCADTANFIIGTGSNITANETISNAVCFGSCDGQITLNPAGGVGPFTYNWTPIPGTTATLSNLCAGGYQVTITDNIGCSKIESFVVGEPREMLATFTRTTESCVPGGDGTVSISVGGGTSPYLYNWGSGNLPGNSVGFLTAGNYNVTVTDASSCTKVFPYVIDPSSAITASSTTTPASCGNSDGTITVSVANSTNPLTFDWSDITVGGADPINLAAGTYTVTVTDGNGCTDVETINVIEDGNYPLNEVITDASCNGVCDGDITLSPSGGVSPYTYLWNDNSTNFFRAGLCAGTYDVTVTDNTGCSTTGSFDVGEPQLLDANLTAVDESCSPGGDGSVTSTPLGGTAPFTYLWSPGGATSSSITSLGSGTYRVTVTDNNGCSVVDSADVASGGNIVLNEVINDANCNGNCNGDITLAPSGGSAPYTYLWDDNSNANNRTALCAGNYDVTVTDNFGCSTSRTFVVSEPAVLEANATATDESCFPRNDGTTNTAASGGTPPYTYLWSSGGATTTGLSGLNNGNYTVTVTDNNGCTDVETVTVNTGGSISLNETVISPTCFSDCDGSITLSPSGGSSPYTYLWDDNSTSFFRTSLCAGDYDVTVTDFFGCRRTATIAVSEPDSLQANMSSTAESCTPGADGTASSSVLGGTAPFTYLWSPGGAITPGISSLNAGTYILTITDNNGCFVVDSTIVNGGGNILFNETIVDATCNGDCDGNISLSPSGGTAPYTYLWDDNSTNFFRAGLCAGTYSVTVTDNTACSTSTSFTVNEPAVLSANLTSTDESCNIGNDGSASTAASGGTPPYTYQWSPGSATTPGISGLSAGTYFVTVTDNNGCVALDTAVINSGANIQFNEIIDEASCNGTCDGRIRIFIGGGTGPYAFLWNDNLTNSNRPGLCAGTYSLTVTDGTGCTKAGTFVVNEPAVLEANAGSIDESCTPGNDGRATTAATGGTAPYTYRWSPGGAVTPNLSSLSAGSYFVTVTDNNGCSDLDTAVVNSGGNIILNEVVNDASCNGDCNGDITLSPSGGVAPYTYLWDDNTTSPTRTSLCAGSYDVTITDDIGCEARRTVVVSEPDPLLANAVPVDEGCAGGDGSVGTSASGGTPPYTYLWSFGSATTPGISGLGAGSYTVTLSDNNGCSTIESVVVNTGGNFFLNETVTDVSCNGECDGSIVLNPSGGISPFTYLWDDNSTDPNRSGLCAGTYAVTVTDATACAITRMLTLVDPPAINLTLNSSSVLICSSTCDGTADVSASGGTAPYTFNWDGGQTGSTPNDLCFGPNILTVTDAIGCTEQLTVDIAAIDTVDAQVPLDTIICDGDSIHLTGVVLGSTVTSFGWYLGDATTLLTTSLDTSILRPVGTYSFFLIATNGSCSDTTEYNPTVVPNPAIMVSPTINIYEDEVATLNISGKQSTYLYNWSPAEGLNDSTLAEPTATLEESRTYVLTVTDTNGCNYIDSIRVIYNEELRIPSGISPNGDGKNDVWRISVLEEFPNASVQIFNRWGELLYEQPNGYKEPWDGTYKGKALPVGTYYYVIDLKSDRFETITGPITIVK